MKRLISFMIIGVALIAQGAWLYAASTNFTLTATVLAANASSISANTLTPNAAGTATVWTPLTGTGMSFDPLTLTTFTNGTQAFLPNHFFAIDVAATGGSGTPSTTVNYVEGASPATSTSTQKLGYRSNIAYAALKYNPPVGGVPQNPTEFTMSAHPPELLRNTVSESITAAQITGAGAGATWLRMYVGLNNGLTSGFDPFTIADPAGAYTGTLQITSTP